MNTPKQPTLADLTGRAMASRQNSDTPPEAFGDVEPHEVLAGIRVDVAAAWADTQLPLTILGVKVSAKSPPADWSAFVEWNPGRLGIPMAAGHFPQRLREVAGLFAADLTDAPGSKTSGFASLQTWIDRSRTSGDSGLKMLASGLARELGTTQVSDRGSSAAELNEYAADLWYQGDREGALAVWQTMAASAVASFNLGMALLMLGRAKAAQQHLWDAVATLPDTSGWCHLAALYLSVAQVRA